MHTVKSSEPRVRIDQITIGRHVRRHGTEGSRSLTSITVVIFANSTERTVSRRDKFAARKYANKIAAFITIFFFPFLIRITNVTIARRSRVSL